MTPLCQTIHCACAACCGLYNVADNDREALQCLLADRSRRFARLQRTVGAIEDFGHRELESRVLEKQPLSGFHHCPYIGFIDETHRKPGCLLHPQVPGNDGKDWRDLCHYGGFACRTYFCPSHEHVSDRIRDLLQQAVDDWYAYSLMITRWRLLTFIERRLFPKSPIERPSAADRIDAVRKAAALVTDWPYRKDPVRDRIHYFFNDARPQPIAPRQTLETWIASSATALRWIDRFEELGSFFHTPAQMMDALRMWNTIEALAEPE